MDRYEFCLRQEILLEQGAGILGDLFRYKRKYGIAEETNPVSILYRLVWHAKQDILTAETESMLDQIQGQFDFASRFLAESGMKVDE